MCCILYTFLYVILTPFYVILNSISLLILHDCVLYINIYLLVRYPHLLLRYPQLYHAINITLLCVVYYTPPCTLSSPPSTLSSTLSRWTSWWCLLMNIHVTSRRITSLLSKYPQKCVPLRGWNRDLMLMLERPLSHYWTSPLIRLLSTQIIPTTIKIMPMSMRKTGTMSPINLTIF